MTPSVLSLLRLLCSLLFLSLLLSLSSAAVNSPGYCKVLSGGYTQRVDASSACQRAADYAVAHPDEWSNPFSSSAYFGSEGWVAGVTMDGAGAACCSGSGVQCVGTCPCIVSQPHCASQTANGTCAVDECEVSPTYEWVATVGSTGLTIIQLSLVVLASVLTVCIAVAARRWARAKRRAAEQRAEAETALLTVSQAAFVHTQ